MRLTKAKFTLWQIMLAIAAFAGLFAGFGVKGTVGILAALSIIIFPILLAPRRHKLEAAVWVCSLYPLLYLGSLYVTWLAAWSVLGRQPQISLDDPKYISPIIDVAQISTMVLMHGMPAALVLCIPLVLAHGARDFQSRGLSALKLAARLVIALLLWSSAFAIVWLRLFGFGYILQWNAH
jgi:hypothetical protein